MYIVVSGSQKPNRKNCKSTPENPTGFTYILPSPIFFCGSLQWKKKKTKLQTFFCFVFRKFPFANDIFKP